MAVIADALHAANWQRAGNKKLPYPKPVQRPGVAVKTRRTTLSASEIDRRLRRLHSRDVKRREVKRGR